MSVLTSCSGRDDEPLAPLGARPHSVSSKALQKLFLVQSDHMQLALKAEKKERKRGRILSSDSLSSCVSINFQGKHIKKKLFVFSWSQGLLENICLLLTNSKHTVNNGTLSRADPHGG
uniref:Uncharacterized protein n=1 Tax=Nothobranchius pienaari TaxID=704102 RepID=A0A1A8LUD4_9TELE